LTAGSAACSQLSTLRKLTSLVAGERATYYLQAMLPAMQALKRLKCIVDWFHTDGSGGLPVLGQLTALEMLHMEGRLVGDYMLAFPSSLKVPKHASGPLMQSCHVLYICVVVYCRSI
jgi:hypothetical protein